MLEQAQFCSQVHEVPRRTAAAVDAVAEGCIPLTFPKTAEDAEEGAGRPTLHRGCRAGMQEPDRGG